MRSFVLQSLAALGWLTASSRADHGKSKTLVAHDETFVPDHILRVTGQNISQACVNRYSAVVNGTSPGPEIRLKAGEAAWIRVYNDMEDSNVTMVSLIHTHTLFPEKQWLLPPSNLNPQHSSHQPCPTTQPAES